MSEESFRQHDVKNKQLKEKNEKLRKENENEKREMANEKRGMTNENEEFRKKNIVKGTNIKELIEEPKEIKSLNWLNKNKFEKILAIIDSKNLITRTK